MGLYDAGPEVSAAEASGELASDVVGGSDVSVSDTCGLAASASYAGGYECVACACGGDDGGVASAAEGE